MKILIYIITLTSLALTSCNNNVIFEENQDLSPNLCWKKEDKKIFKVNIDDIDAHYQIQLNFRYTEGFSSDDMKVLLKEIAPDKSEKETEHVLKIKNKNGEYIGEAGLDIWDSEHIILKNYKFQHKGVYTFEISENMPVEKVLFSMEIGLVIEKQ